MQHTIISGALIALGFGLLFFLDNLISKNTEYSILKNVRENNLIIALLCLGAGYYVYTLGQKQQSIIQVEDSLDTSEPLVRDELLPSYEQATSTD
jgi:hypothetical protein